MIAHMKEKVTIPMKVDMMIEKEIMFQENTHQKIMKIKDPKKGTQNHVLILILTHLHHPVLSPKEVVAETIKSMKIKGESIQEKIQEKKDKLH